MLSAFRARRHLAVSNRVATVVWLVLAVVACPVLIAKMTSSNSLVVLVASVVLAHLFASTVLQGSRSVIGVCEDGSVIIARVGLLSDRIQGITQIYAPTTAITIEPATPWWRHQRIMIGGDQWYASSDAARFRPRTAVAA